MEEQSPDSHGWFAAFCAWMQETRPGTSLEEQLIATEEAFKPIVERALAQTGVAVDDSDVDACFDVVLRRIENKLERREFRLVSQSRLNRTHPAFISFLPAREK